MISIPIAAAGVSLAPVAVKAVGEIHRQVVLQSNTLARQGNGTPSLPGIEDTMQRQRAGGIKGSLSPGKADPGYLGKVPSRPIAGDDREGFKTPGRGNATSSRGRLADILSKVPTNTVGASSDYKRANKPLPKRAGGFGNQSFSP